jgi:hypothetical protein
LESSNFVQRLYGNGKAFKGTSDGQADRDLNRTSAVEYSPEERSFYRYPFDLGDTPEHQNFMVFDIFVNEGEGLSSEKSKKPSLIKAAGALDKIVKKATGAATLGKALVPEGLAISTLLGSFAKADTGILGGFNKASGVLKKVNFYTSGMAGNVAKQLVGAGKQNLNDLGKGEESFVQEALGLGETLKRANKTIFLYMPGGVSSKYGAKYTEKDFTTIGQVSTAVSGGIKNLVSMATQGHMDKSTAQASEALSKQMAMGTVKELGEKLNEIGEKAGLESKGGGNLAELIEAGQHRKAKNPFVLQLFESVDRRSFEYDFEFAPRSQDEVDEIYSIIRTFKRHALPARALGGRFLDFPAEFRITYVNMDKENLYLNRIARCALTEISVDYGTNPFTTFRPDDSGAAPTQIKMKLSFSELEILTQERIDQGF